MGSLEILPEIVEAVGGSTSSHTMSYSKDFQNILASISFVADAWYDLAEMKIIFDSGVRTGPDIFKAIALGADAVQVGRLYVWGMSHEGEAGCRHVIKSLLAVRPHSPFPSLFLMLTVRMAVSVMVFGFLGLGHHDDRRWVPEP